MKIVLLGDSIRQQYGKNMGELLGDGFEVFQPEDNCRFAKYLLRMLFDYESDMRGASIAHFNCGHWDLNNLFGDGPLTSLEEYGENVLRIAKILLSRHEKVIFATTTPTGPENKYNKNDVIISFNEYIVPKLKEIGVIINDLHSLVYSDIDRYIRSDTLHLSDEGVEICAKATAEIIKREASSLEQRADLPADAPKSEGIGYSVLL